MEYTYDSAKTGPDVMLEYQSRELAAKPDDGCMETIYGPLPQHKYVPLWVYLAREDYPEVFQEALSLYFERTGWPELGEMDETFQEECERAGVSGVAFRKTVGFAPVWIFILDIISKANIVDRRWFDTCVDEFFEYGSFPELSSMPDKLLQACEKMDVTDYDFYVPDM
ncbi:hypothetical protein R5R35_004244 [Gryllus longicercus]|uniref:Uncharacterized protein n=1 Tax=Gryllus longicercus TaxID=2509291 RepID=A0AAN9ZGS0_9ORTH